MVFADIIGTLIPNINDLIIWCREVVRFVFEEYNVMGFNISVFGILFGSGVFAMLVWTITKWLT